MSAVKYLDKSLFIKPRFPKKETKKFDYLSESEQIKATKTLISVNIYAKSLLFELKKMQRLGMLNNYSLIIDFMAEMSKLQSYFEKEILSKNKDNNDIFKDKLRAIENINDYLLISDDETIFRTEKFIESILTKKR